MRAKEAEIIHADSDVPEGWLRTTLPEICHINPPKPASKSFDHDALVTFVPMPAVDAELGAITKPQLRPFSQVRKGFTAFREGDVIMAKITPCMENGKAAIARGLTNEVGFGSTEFHVLRPKEGVLSDFIYYFIRQASYRKLAEAEMTGSVGQKRVPVEFIQQSEILLPSSAEQSRIVERVEDLLRHAKASQSHLVTISRMLKTFRQSVLAAACSGRLTEDWRDSHPEISSARPLLSKIEEYRRRNGVRPKQMEERDLDSSPMPELPDTWTWASMYQVGDVQGGIQKQPKRTPKLNAYPYLRVANVLRGRLDLDEIHQMELFEGELDTYKLKAGDLLIVEGNGSLAEIGRSALWHGAIKDCVHQNHIIRVRPVVCSSEYLTYYWNSPVGAERVAEVAVTTAGLYSLSTKKVATLPVAVAPLAEQHEIVRRVEALFKLADAIERRVAVAQARADKLTQSILAKAFRGELVPTEAELARQEGREYEPASVLLEKIRAERSAANTDQMTSRRTRDKTATAHD